MDRKLIIKMLDGEYSDDRIMQNTEEMRVEHNQMCVTLTKLLATLSSKQRKIFDDYDNLHALYNSSVVDQHYIEGFKLAMRLCFEYL